MSIGELAEQRPLGDRDRALLIGAEFGLGTLEQVSRDRKFPGYTVWGFLLGPLVAIVGVPVAAGVARGPHTPATKLVVAVVFGGLLAICCLATGIGVARSEPRNRLFRYSGGLAQLLPGEPEPRVARWADVSEFTVSYFEGEDVAARLDGFSLRTGTGTQLPGLSGYRRQSQLRAIVAEAGRSVAPRLISAMTEAYESGGTVKFGRVSLSQEGVTIWPPEENLVPWADIRSIHVTYVSGTDYPDEVIIGQPGKPARQVSVSGLANGIFLPSVLAYAAARHGVTVTGDRASPRLG
jgi:hypothetical protein